MYSRSRSSTTTGCRPRDSKVFSEPGLGYVITGLLRLLSDSGESHVWESPLQDGAVLLRRLFLMNE